MLGPATPVTVPLTFSCPECGTPLERLAPDQLRCPSDGALYYRQDGIWRFLLSERETALAPFMRDYETVRRSEGRGDTDPAYYRALPFRDLSGRFENDWRIRAASFLALESHLMQRGVALDVGAGCGWLAYRLAQRGLPSPRSIFRPMAGRTRARAFSWQKTAEQAAQVYRTPL